MSHTVDIAQGHKTRGIVAFLPISFGLEVRACGCPQPRHTPIKYGSVGEEKEPGNETLPDLDARSSDA
jgi:hypothetical protein